MEMTLHKQLRRQSLRRGFTLMEILIVVAIIVVLAGVGTVYLLPQLESSKEDTAHLRAKQIETAVVSYYAKYKKYPESLEVLAQQQPDGGKPIISAEGLLDPWDRPYQIRVEGEYFGGAKPEIYTTNPSTGREIGNWRPR
jgi:general secretion pathway protein G